MDKKKILEAIEKMSVLELSDLVKDIEEKFGVSAMSAMPVGGMMAAGAVAGAEQTTEEKTNFNVILSSAGDKKIQVIKVVRELTGLGLKEAKELVEGVPKPIKEGVEKTQAEEMKKKIEEAGGKVELK